MTETTPTHVQDSWVPASSRTLFLCTVLAVIVELSVIYLSGIKFSIPLPHPAAPEQLTDVEVIPEEAPRLKSETTAPAAPQEETLAEKPTQASKNSAPLTEPAGNQVIKGKPMSATHGPVLIESPAPVIPDYLKNHDLSTKVLIEFNVLPSGASEPRLLVSSGDEELDQVALAAAKKWKFYPAETDHQAVAAKVRLRILFSVK
jgi:protein TonB